MAGENYSPMDCDDVGQHDQTTATQQQRAVTAANRYRTEAASQYSGFDPAPSAPSSDPDPPTEADDIRPNESVKVGYYDGLTATHRGDTATEVSRFDDELEDYADYYEESTGEEYEMPQSEVEPMQIVDDDPGNPQQSNLVGAYDAAASGYSSISNGASGRTSTQSSSYTSNMTAAGQKFGTIQGSGNGSISKFESDVKNRLDQMVTNVHDSLIHVEDIN